MSNLVLFAVTFLISVTSFAHDGGPGVTNAKAAELTAHRIDRLVTLGKIDAAFLARFDRLDLTVVGGSPVYYKVLVSQTQPAVGTPFQLEINFDDDGKPVSSQVLPGGSEGPDLGWTTKDAVSLSENALHYVLENTNDAKIALFDKGLSSFSLFKAQFNGQDAVLGVVQSSLTSEKLHIYLTLDGTFLTAELKP